MARPLRIQYPGAFYHVINRGNAGEELFKSDRDHEKFLELLDTGTERFAIRIHTYCLMTNPYHFLVEPSPTTIYIARDLTVKANANLGGYFGGISGAVTVSKHFKNKVNRIKNQIINSLDNDPIFLAIY